MRYGRDRCGNLVVNSGLGWMPAPLGAFVSSLVAPTAVAAARAAAVGPNTGLTPPQGNARTYVPQRQTTHADSLTRSVTCQIKQSGGGTKPQTTECDNQATEAECCAALQKLNAGTSQIDCVDEKGVKLTINCDNNATAFECCNLAFKAQRGR